MSYPQESSSEFFEEITVEIGASVFFYQQVDSIRPDILHLTAATEQVTEEEAQKFYEALRAVARSDRVDQAVLLQQIDESTDERLAPLKKLSLKCFMRLPLVAHDRLLGAVSFGSSARSVFQAADQELVRTFAEQLAAALERQRLVLQLRESEQIYRGAVITGRLASWETNMVTRERIWTEEGMAMFGLDLPNGRGIVGGDDDEFWRTLHPEDRYKVAGFHRTANEIDSYPAEYRILRADGSLSWMSGRGRVIERGPDGKARRVANMVVDVTERKRSEERTKLLIDELNHRVKNTLATVQAIVGQTLKDGQPDKEARATIEARLQSLSRSHDLLTRENWEGAALHNVVEQALHPFMPSGAQKQVRVDGPQLRLRPKVALSLGMALHELATNASKYGALSVDSGRIDIQWKIARTEGQQRVDFTWSESGGPQVQPRTRRGFGSRLIEHGLAHELGGSAGLSYLPEGINCKISFQWGDEVP